MPLDRDRFMATTYGYSTGEWQNAQAWLARHLHDVARRQAKTTYGDICNAMSAAGGISLEPNSTALAGLLGQLNILEQEQGRPLISAIVVHKTDDWLPGVGFWNIAREIGIDPGRTENQRLEFWVNEFGRCHAYWGSH